MNDWHEKAKVRKMRLELYITDITLNDLITTMENVIHENALNNLSFRDKFVICKYLQKAMINGVPIRKTVAESEE
jgi:hypothetical protein